MLGGNRILDLSQVRQIRTQAADFIRGCISKSELVLSNGNLPASIQRTFPIDLVIRFDIYCTVGKKFFSEDSCDSKFNQSQIKFPAVLTKIWHFSDELNVTYSCL